MTDIYLGVGARDALYSSIWKAWTQGDEFYAMPVNGLNALMKLSVHSSGICRLANVKGAPEDFSWDEDVDPRVLKRWTVPPVDGPEDGVLCFSLLVPSVFVPERLSISDSLQRGRLSKISWVAPASIGQATLIQFVRTRDASTRPAQDLGELVGTLDLRSGGRLWCLRREQRIPVADFQFWQSEVAKAIFTIAGPVREGSLFAALQSAADFSSPVVRDVALGRRNFRVGSNSDMST